MIDNEFGDCNYYNEEWLNQAIETLRQYNIEPFTNVFMKKHNLPITNIGREMYDLIKKTIIAQDSQLQFGDLVEYIDELRMWGRQHVFLFKIKNEEREYLECLSSPEDLLEQLRLLKLENRYNNNICKWSSETPFLAEVKYILDNQGEREWLKFKWIETRKFEIIIDDQLQNSNERSANFLLINLKNGLCEIRIQTLQPNPEKKLDEELKVYIEIIKKLLKFNHFSQISLESTMKHFLLKSVLPLVSWEFKTKKALCLVLM